MLLSLVPMPPGFGGHAVPARRLDRAASRSVPKTRPQTRRAREPLSTSGSCNGVEAAESQRHVPMPSPEVRMAPYPRTQPASPPPAPLGAVSQD